LKDKKKKTIFFREKKMTDINAALEEGFMTEDAYFMNDVESDEEEGSEEEDESLPIHEQIKKQHVKLSARIIQEGKIRKHLIRQFKKKGQSNEEGTDMVFEDERLRVLYDNLLYHGLDTWTFADIYPNVFKHMLEKAMFAEYRERQTQLFWPRESSAEEVYSSQNERNPLNSEFERLAPFKPTKWRLSDGQFLAKSDLEPLREYYSLLYRLMRDCTTKMFVRGMFGDRSHYNDKGFLECEQERFRIMECLDKCEAILYAK
jgi:hypothetical protein